MYVRTPHVDGVYAEPDELAIGSGVKRRRQRALQRRLERAKELLRAGSVDQAVTLLADVRDELPPDEDVWLELAFAHRSAGRIDDAITCASIAHEYAPTSCRILRELAVAYGEDPESLDRAIEGAERAVELDPADPLNWTVLAQTCLAAKDAVGAATAAERALAVDPFFVQAFVVLGETAMLGREWDTAAHCFEQALNLAPSNEAAWAGLRWVQRERGESVPAAENADLSGARSPHLNVAPPDGYEPNGHRPTWQTADVSSSTQRSSDRESADSFADDHSMQVDPASNQQPQVQREEPEHAGASDGDDGPWGAERSQAWYGLPTPMHEPSTRASGARAHGDVVEAMNQEVLEAVRRHIDAYNRRDIDALLAGFSEDALFRVADDIFVGRADLQDLFMDAFAADDDFELHLRCTVVQNGTAACELTERVTSDSEIYESELVGLYTVTSGRIIRARLYRD